MSVQLANSISQNAISEWSNTTPETFWEKADQLQEETLAEANKLFCTLKFVPPSVLREILIQYRYFTVYYIPDLALLTARMQDGPLRSFLSDILYDELGCGKPENAHPRLYDSFLESIGVDADNLADTALQENVELLDEARRQLVDPKLSTEYAMGLRGMGGECVCQVYIAQLHEWLMQNPYIRQRKDDIDWVFWDLHVGDHDIEHREQTRALIDQEIVQKGGDQLRQLGEGYAYSMLSWKQFWHNIFRLRDGIPYIESVSRASAYPYVDVQIIDQQSQPATAMA